MSFEVEINIFLLVWIIFLSKDIFILSYLSSLIDSIEFVLYILVSK